MPVFYILHNKAQTDRLIAQICGKARCVPGASTGPVVKSRYALHYIHSGSGILKTQDTVYELTAGEGFITMPGRLVYYEASHTTPWDYTWIGFDGYKADTYLRRAGITLESPTFRVDNDEVEKLFLALRDLQTLQEKEMRMNALLWLIVSSLIERRGDSPPAKYDPFTYIQEAIEYIQSHYDRDMSISEISRHVGLDNSYLGALFKKHTKVSLQQFLLNHRVEKACILLQDRTLSIGDVARSVGYDNPYTFTRAFKRMMDCPPTEYRNRLS